MFNKCQPLFVLHAEIGVFRACFNVEPTRGPEEAMLPLAKLLQLPAIPKNLSACLPSFIYLFLWPYLQHMEVPKAGVESELQLLAYTTTTAAQDPSHGCDVYCSSRQCWILNPLIEARHWTCILVDASQVLDGRPTAVFFKCSFQIPFQ